MTAEAVDVAIERTELERALADDASFERWYARFLPRVYAYLANRAGSLELAEELTQLTFIAAIEQRWRFDGRADMVTWLCGIARHKLADHFRVAERATRRDARLAVREIAMDRPARLVDVEERDAIRTALSRLQPAQRAILLFVDLDGLPVADAGRLLGRSHGAAQSLLFRAREAFRAAYAREVPHD